MTASSSTNDRILFQCSLLCPSVIRLLTTSLSSTHLISNAKFSQPYSAFNGVPKSSRPLSSERWDAGRIPVGGQKVTLLPSPQCKARQDPSSSLFQTIFEWFEGQVCRWTILAAKSSSFTVLWTLSHTTRFGVNFLAVMLGTGARSI
jgi:hypothetical protein